VAIVSQAFPHHDQCGRVRSYTEAIHGEALFLREQEEEELWVQGGPGMNEVSFCARPHRNVHSTLGVDTGATCPLCRVDSIEGGEKNGHVRWERDNDTSDSGSFVF
jgi:hypothetical protein